MENEKVVMTSTHVDSHNEKLSKELLFETAESINSDNRKVGINIEHDVTLPPFGQVQNAEVIEGKDGEYYLIAENKYYDQKELINFNGITYVKESFTNSYFPFRIKQNNQTDNLSIEVDPNNFQIKGQHKTFFDELKSETTLAFNDSIVIRKSELPDPIVIITLVKEICIYYFGYRIFHKLTEKIADKIGENIGNDINKFYDLVKNIAKKMTKYAKPRNRPVVYVFQITNDVVLELIVKTNNPDILLLALMKEEISKIEDKIEILIEQFKPDKIQFLYNERFGWGFNYLIDKNGQSIGTLKTYEKRNFALKMFNKIHTQNLSLEGIKRKLRKI